MRLTVVNLPDRFGENMIKDLFNGAWCRGARIGQTTMPPLSLLYAYTAMKPHFTDAQVIDAVQERLGAEGVVERLGETDLLVAHTSGYTLNDDRSVLATIKQSRPEMAVAIFGNLTALQANGLIADGVVDFVCCQDPEETFAQLARAWSPSKGLTTPIAGLHTAQEQSPAPRALIPLDEKCVPDRAPILHHRYRNLLARKARWTTALTTRGCPFTCTFCNTPGYYDRKYRRHSIDYVIDELHYLASEGYEEVFFRDDLFHAGRVGELCEAMIERGPRLVWSCNHRVDTLDKETLKLMHRAGCHTIKFGVESGDDDLLKDIGKPQQIQAMETFAACREIGIRTHAHLMIGLPGETREQMDRTVSFLHRLSPFSFSMGMFTPHRGSELYVRMADRGHLTTGQWKDQVNGNPSEVSDDELRHILRSTYLRFYLNPQRAARMLMGGKRWSDLAQAGTQMIRSFVR